MIPITPYSHYYRVGVHISYRVRLWVTVLFCLAAVMVLWQHAFRSDLFGIRCGSGSPTFPCHVHAFCISCSTIPII